MDATIRFVRIVRIPLHRARLDLNGIWLITAIALSNTLLSDLRLLAVLGSVLLSGVLLPRVCVSVCSGLICHVAAGAGARLSRLIVPARVANSLGGFDPCRRRDSFSLLGGHSKIGSGVWRLREP